MRSSFLVGVLNRSGLALGRCTIVSGFERLYFLFLVFVGYSLNPFFGGGVFALLYREDLMVIYNFCIRVGAPFRCFFLLNSFFAD